MQGDVELGLVDNEQILAIGDKNQVFFICGTALLAVIAVVGILAFFLISNPRHIYDLIRILSLLCAGFSLWLIKFLYDSYQNNQIYITENRIIITQKDSIEGIPFEEVQYFNSADFDFSTLNLKSKRKIIFAYNNLNDIKQEFIKLYPNYKQPLITLRQVVLLAIIIFAGIMVSIPEKYFKMAYYFLLPNRHKIIEKIQIVDAESYMEYMQRTLKLHWSPPKLDSDSQVVVEFKIKPDGTIFDEKIKQTSGSREMDNSALFAIRNANPLNKLPDDLKYEKEVKINFTFDYNVTKKNN